MAAPRGNKYTVGNGGGRPVQWTAENIERERVALEKWISDPENYCLDSFCNQRKYARERLREFCADSPEFADTMDRTKQTQEERLVHFALTRKHDPGFTKFVLANRAGWKEKTEVSGDVVNPLSFILREIDGKNADSKCGLIKSR